MSKRKIGMYEEHVSFAQHKGLQKTAKRVSEGKYVD